jgi:methionine synthase reductase
MLNKVVLGWNGEYTRPVIRSTSSIRVATTELPEDDYYSRPFFKDLELRRARIVEVEDLGTRWRKVYRIKLDAAFDYVPGDSLGLYSPNDDSLVDEMMMILGMDDFRCRIESTGAVVFSYAGTLRNFFKLHYDFTSLPRKSFLMGLSQSCSGENRKRIEYLCSREGKGDYFRMSTSWNNVIDVIRTFGSRPSLNDLLCDCELIKPRPFSLINRSGSESEILLGVVEKETGDGTRYGHASGFIMGGGMEEVTVYLRPSKTFSLGEEKRILAICTGTGIAPVLSFMNNLGEHQSLWIIYGFREDRDDITQRVRMSEDVRVTRVRSSDGMYVQDHIRKNMREVEDYVMGDCSIYICGRMEMQRSIFTLLTTELGSPIDQEKMHLENWL